MARKSRKETAVAVKNMPQLSERKIYRTVIYVRLSSEDERKILSESIENQIALLKDFVEAKEDLQLVGIYVDRGISGTKFDRPDFNQLVEDMREKRFDCVVVKDLSRLGRDYLVTGDYLETIFPYHGIRFIAVTDDYDSLYASSAEVGVVVPFKNIINEAYAKDASQKSAALVEERQKAGLFVGRFAPYGYRKDPENVCRLIVDEAVRENVVLIFQSKADGMSVNGITKMLNEKGIVPPMKRRQQLGVGKKHKYADNLWDSKCVSRILRNVAYMGDMEQGFEKKVLYLGIAEKNRAPEKRYYVKNTHEPIVSRELFATVQGMLDTMKCQSKNVHDKYMDMERRTDIFQGLLYCGNCNRRMMFYRRTMKLKEGHKHYYTYVCRYASYAEEHPCKKNRIKMEELEKLVSMLLHQQIEMFLDTEDLLKRLNREPKIRKIADGYDEECNEMKRKLEHTRVIISELYSDFTDGILEEQDYLYAKKQYQNQINELEVKLAELEYLRDSHMADFSVNRKMDEIIRQYSDFTELASELLNALIERITFYGDDRYEVKYRFGEEFRVLLELVEQRKDELSCVEAV